MRLRSVCAISAILCIFASGYAESASVSVTYSYDSLGRVVTALYDNGTCIVYGYDASGNRTSQSNTTEPPTWGVGVWGCSIWTSGSGYLSRRAKGRHPPVAPPPSGPPPGAVSAISVRSPNEVPAANATNSEGDAR